MTQAITAVGTRVFLGPPAGEPGGYLLIGELGSMTPVGREWDVNDVTSFTSPTKAKEKIKGLLNPGQYFLVGNRIFDDASQAALKVAFDDPRRPYMFQVVFPINPYTGAGEIWTFAALVLSIDPPKIAPNKALQFFCKLQATGARQTSNGYQNATGMARKTFSVSLGGNGWGVIWTDFALSSLTRLPSDAVIQGIYPVIIASGIFDIAFQSLECGPASPAAFTTPNVPPLSTAGSFPSTEFYGPSIGTSLSVLAGQFIRMSINSSLFKNPVSDEIAATGVGYAIDYTSSRPKIDPQMPPPFAVPAGHGLGWAIPFTFQVLGPPAANGIVSATAATLNSI